jgi:hypothetical protein
MKYSVVIYIPINSVLFFLEMSFIKYLFHCNILKIVLFKVIQCFFFGSMGVTFFNDLIWFGLVWFDLIWFDLIWFDLIWFDLIWLNGNNNKNIKIKTQYFRQTSLNITILKVLNPYKGELRKKYTQFDILLRAFQCYKSMDDTPLSYLKCHKSTYKNLLCI